MNVLLGASILRTLLAFRHPLQTSIFSHSKPPSSSTVALGIRNMAEVGRQERLTTKQLLDRFTAKKPEEISKIRHLLVKAYPFPTLYHPNDNSFTTYLFEDLIPLFPGLKLEVLDWEDAFHGPQVDEDGWGHNCTYQTLTDLIKNGKGWKELMFRSASDRWLEPVTFTASRNDSSWKEKHDRSSQPGTWDSLIKERDGEDSGARVEMWQKLPGVDEEWKSLSTQNSPYQASGQRQTEELQTGGTETSMPDHKVKSFSHADEISGPRSSIIVRVSRGEGVDYTEDGLLKGEDEFARRLTELFQRYTWKEMQEKELYHEFPEANTCALL